MNIGVRRAGSGWRLLFQPAVAGLSTMPFHVEFDPRGFTDIHAHCPGVGMQCTGHGDTCYSTAKKVDGQCMKCHIACHVVRKNYLCQRCFEEQSQWPVCPVHRLRPSTASSSQPALLPPGLPAMPAVSAVPAPRAPRAPPAPPAPAGGQLPAGVFALMGRVAQLEQQLQVVLTTVDRVAQLEQQLQVVPATMGRVAQLEQQFQVALATMDRVEQLEQQLQVVQTTMVQFQASTRPASSSAAEATPAVQSEPAAVRAEPAAAWLDGSAQANGSVHDSESSTEFTHC